MRPSTGVAPALTTTTIGTPAPERPRPTSTTPARQPPPTHRSTRPQGRPNATSRASLLPALEQCRAEPAVGWNTPEGAIEFNPPGVFGPESGRPRR